VKEFCGKKISSVGDDKLIDFLKMGLIGSGKTKLTLKAVENRQNLIVEGCYIPFGWEADFEEKYQNKIRYYCLVMSKSYIERHFEDIKKYADRIERRLDDTECTRESVAKDNAYYLEMCQKYDYQYILIDDWHHAEIEL
jgi:hypothetical protein